MRGSERKLKLNANHRRILSVVLRSLEELQETLTHRLEKRSGILYRVQADLTPGQGQRLLELSARLRREIQRLAGEMELDIAVQSPRRAIAALLSAAIIDLEECNPAGLQGHGPLSAEAKRKLESELRRLIPLLEEMMEIVEKD